MKSLLFIHAFLLVICTGMLAQNAGKVTYNANNKIHETLAMEAKYRYPEFQGGQVFFRNGGNGIGRLNYNVLLKEVHFIDPKGDTLALDEIETVKYLVIGTDSFYYDKELYEIIGNYGSVRLAVKNLLREVDRQKIGGFDMASSASSIDAYKSINLNQGNYNLSIRENIIYSKEKIYFLRHKEKQFVPLNWFNIAKAFPSKKNKIEAFVSANNIDLKKEEDIKKLFTWCIEK